ncbi:MAG: helicase, partial [Bacteroidales bacterium]|nr:helicase [Bacteroidales bacterium]
NQFEDNDIQEEVVGNQQCITEIMENSVEIRDRLYGKREKQLNKMYTFLEKSFNQQYRETLKRLDKYQQENIDNRNSALINQMNAKLMDLDIKKEDRLELVNQQKNVSLKPPKLVISLDAVPTGECQRVLANDYYDVISEYERANGRLNVKQYNNLGLIDFSSERFNGEQRFIVLTIDPGFTFSENELEDLRDILEMVYVYVVEDGEIREEKLIYLDNN